VRKTLVSGLTVSLILFYAGGASAQESSGAPQADAAQASGADIVVTATRREQTALSVPIAITAVGGDALATKGITNSVGLTAAVPNLQISSPYGDTQPNFSLRGISVANEYNSNQASPIGVYINDVYMASRVSHGMGLFDLDRVEVLRGPQGTLFGRNTTGGAINFITKGPSLSDSNGYVQAGYGNYDTWTGQFAAETTFIDDQLGMRVAGNFVKGDGRIKNIYPGVADGNSQDTLQGRATLRYATPDRDLDIKLLVYGGRDRGTQAASHGFLPSRAGLGFFEVNDNRMGSNKTGAWGALLNIGYKISDEIKITSITARDGGRMRLGQSGDSSPLDLLYIQWNSNFDQFSQELRLNYDTSRFHLVTGGFYGWDRTVTENTYYIGSALGAGVDGGFFQHFRQSRRSYAVFAQADYEIAHNLTLTAGLRYTADRNRYLDSYAYLFAGGALAPQTPIATTGPCATAPGTCAYDPAARLALNGKNNALTGRASISYKFEGGPLVYLSYNRGYRSGAFNGGSYTTSSGINYVKPEQLNAYEAGVKGRFLNNRLSLTAAAFYYDYSNQQLQDQRPGPIGILVNAPKSEVYGGEIEGNMRFNSAFSFNFAAGFLKTQYKELVLQGVNLAGNDLPFAPTWTAQAGFDWNLISKSEDKLVLSPNINYTSHQFFSPFNNSNATGTGMLNSELQQGGYAKINANLTWTHGRYTLQAWANNMFNRKVYSYGLDLRGPGFPYNFLVPAAPRTYGGSVKVTF
jgi:iron complex outermembrane receptor protein